VHIAFRHSIDIFVLITLSILVSACGVPPKVYKDDVIPVDIRLYADKTCEIYIKNTQYVWREASATRVSLDLQRYICTVNPRGKIKDYFTISIGKFGNYKFPNPYRYEGSKVGDRWYIKVSGGGVKKNFQHHLRITPIPLVLLVHQFSIEVDQEAEVIVRVKGLARRVETV